jgi:hypothetical protein
MTSHYCTLIFCSFRYLVRSCYDLFSHLSHVRSLLPHHHRHTMGPCLVSVPVWYAFTTPIYCSPELSICLTHATRILALASYQSSDGIAQGPNQEIDSFLRGPGLICLSCPRVCSLAVEMKATVITRSIYCINYSHLTLYLHKSYTLGGSGGPPNISGALNPSSSPTPALLPVRSIPPASPFLRESFVPSPVPDPVPPN